MSRSSYFSLVRHGIRLSWNNRKLQLLIIVAIVYSRRTELICLPRCVDSAQRVEHRFLKRCDEWCPRNVRAPNAITLDAKFSRYHTAFEPAAFFEFLLCYRCCLAEAHEATASRVASSENPDTELFLPPLVHGGPFTPHGLRNPQVVEWGLRRHEVEEGDTPPRWRWDRCASGLISWGSASGAFYFLCAEYNSQRQRAFLRYRFGSASICSTGGITATKGLEHER